ncbi:acetyltransferase [Lacticaseibacillus paracasei]
MESEVDDVYISQVTGEPVYVEIKGVLYKLTKVEDEK